MASEMIRQDKDCVNIPDIRGPEEANNTPLILAIKKGYYGLANDLLQAGANFTIASGDKGFTPLHWAMVCIGTTETIEEKRSSSV